MSTELCAERDAVFAAIADGRMDAPWVLAHLARCAACGALADAVFAEKLAAALDAGLSDAELSDAELGDAELSDDEAALIVCGMAPMPEKLSARDRERLARAQAALDGDGASAVGDVEGLIGDDVDRVWPASMQLTASADGSTTADARRVDARLVDAPTAGETPGAVLAWPGAADRSTAPRRRARAVWLGAAAALAAAALVWVAVRPGEPHPGAELLTARGSAEVGVALSVGDRMCLPSTDKEVGAPCRWQAEGEQIHIYYRREPTAAARYVAVFARDAEGDVSLLYPAADGAQVPLEVTRQRKHEDCARGLCWLEGGVYKVPAGRYSVVAVFGEAPLPVESLSKSAGLDAWESLARTGERFELEVVP